MNYDAKKVLALFDRSLEEAKSALRGLAVAAGREPRFSGLNGWVFEQTVEHCLREELELLGPTSDVEEQVALGGRAKVDLRVGRTAIEIKRSGLFGDSDVARYTTYRALAEEKGWRYVFLSGAESYGPYRTGIIKALGSQNVVILDGEGGEWERFVGIVAEGLVKQGG
jgi:hypothetical protein